MSQQAVTITSLPIEFEMVKAMQAKGLEWDEGYRPLGRQAVAAIIEEQMAASIATSPNPRPTTALRPTGATGTTNAIC